MRVVDDWMDPILAEYEEEDGVRVTEVPMSGVADVLLVRESVSMHDVLWFSPHPPPIESGEIPCDQHDDPDGDERSSVAPVAMSTVELDDEPRREARGWRAINPLIAAGVLGAIVAAAHFAQPGRHGSPVAHLALAFPDRMVIDIPEETVPIWVYDLPVAPSPSTASGPATAPLAARARLTSPFPQPVATPAPQATRLDPPADRLPSFSNVSALTALSSVAGGVRACLPSTSGSVRAEVQVTFAPSGRVTQAIVVSSPFAGTPVGGCAARVFRAARMDPFDGPHVTVHRTVTVR